jgi:hypothetical protein
VPDYEGIYEAQQDPPRVRSLDRIVNDGRGGYRCLRGRIMYGPKLILSRNGISEHTTVAEVIERTYPALATAV